MPVHKEQRVLGYPAAHLFNLVADVKRYPEFLPWVTRAHILESSPEKMVADLEIGYKLLTDTYRSQVLLTPHTSIEVSCLQGPFKHLENQWLFDEQPDGKTTVSFFIDFEFKSSLLQGLMNAVFEEAVKRMMSAFEERAQFLYAQKAES